MPDSQVTTLGYLSCTSPRRHVTRLPQTDTHLEHQCIIHSWKIPHRFKAKPKVTICIATRLFPDNILFEWMLILSLDYNVL